jgi:hypothetical protein
MRTYSTEGFSAKAVLRLMKKSYDIYLNVPWFEIAIAVQYIQVSSARFSSPRRDDKDQCSYQKQIDYLRLGLSVYWGYSLHWGVIWSSVPEWIIT